MKLIIIRGPGGASKSTVSKIIAEKLREKNKVAVINADLFYWDISGEETNRDIIYEAIRRLEDLYLNNNYNVIIEGIMSSKKDNELRIERFIEFGKKYNIDIKLFFLNIPKEESEKRVRKKAKKDGWEFKKEDIDNWYDKIQNSRHKDEIQINAQKLEPHKIAELILDKFK
ncbi:AAA family ATPase [Candidatus Woesearchaeota archaeon]|nr:AAA family ATPase [Candidatus Woesearchaeota archaeon]